MIPLGDRRVRVRFEVVGTLHGVLEFSEPPRVLNLSAGGALDQDALAAACGVFADHLLERGWPDVPRHGRGAACDASRGRIRLRRWRGIRLAFPHSGRLSRGPPRSPIRLLGCCPEAPRAPKRTHAPKHLRTKHPVFSQTSENPDFADKRLWKRRLLSAFAGRCPASSLEGKSSLALALDSQTNICR